jgi:transcriptional regulator with PAS, ATPase and Fis domain
MNTKLNKSTLTFLRQRYGIVGTSDALMKSIEMLVQAAPTDLSVLINGETGTGKDVFANAIHGLSERKRYPFISVNCGAIPETLLESELFGHERGAFTGATEQRKGFFETAHKGTIFLDEIGEMPYNTQVKLLRVLESGEFMRLGSSDMRKVDVRIIAATNRRLEEAVSQGTFRQDLYFRLRNVQLILPPLRERQEDIPELVDFFGKRICEKLSIKYEGFSVDSLEILRKMPWLGNIRELRNLVETLITIEKTGSVDVALLRKYLPPALPAHEEYTQPKELSLIPVESYNDTQKFELALILRTLLELKNDTTEVRRQLNTLAGKIDSMKAEIIELQEIAGSVNVQEVSSAFTFERLSIAEAEKLMIEQALKRSLGNRRMAAQALKISERTLYRKIHEYGLEEL